MGFGALAQPRTKALIAKKKINEIETWMGKRYFLMFDWIPQFAISNPQVLFPRSLWVSLLTSFIDSCIYAVYTCRVIVNFLHRGLKRLFQRGESRAFPTHHVPILEDILFRLDTAQDIKAMNLPAYHLHQLTGNFKGFWSMTVAANYRVIFKFKDGHATDVDYLDYHGKK